MSTIISASASAPAVWTVAPKLSVVITACYPAAQALQRLQATLTALCLVLWSGLSSAIGVALAALLAIAVASTKLSFRAITNIVCSLASVSRRGSRRLRQSKMAARWNKRWTLEVAMVILSPAGNAVFLMVFWPGWWILGGLSCLIWLCSR